MREIKIDFDNPGLPQRLDVVENDAQSRFFKAVLYKDGKAYTAPDGATYSIMYRGFGPQNEGWYDTINDGAGKRAACSVSGNVVTCEIARQALRIPGHVSVMLCVTGSNGYMLHGWPIDCNCRNDSYTNGTSVESFFYITQVTNTDWNSAIQTWEELKNMIDPTLSISGKAADAKVMGDKIGELKEDINDITNKTKNLFDKNKIVTGYRLGDNGTLVLDEQLFVSDYIEVQAGKTYTKNITTDVYHRFWCCDENKQFIRQKQKGDSINILNGEKYIRFCGYIGEINQTVLQEGDELTYIPHRIVNNILTPELFGAIGDGLSDDTLFIKKCLTASNKYGYPMRAERKYRVTNPLAIEGEYLSISINSIIYDGDNAALVITSAFSTINISRIKASNGCGIRLTHTDSHHTKSNKIYVGHIECYSTNSKNAIEIIDNPNTKDSRYIYANTLIFGCLEGNGNNYGLYASKNKSSKNTIMTNAIYGGEVMRFKWVVYGDFSGYKFYNFDMEASSVKGNGFYLTGHDNSIIMPRYSEFVGKDNDYGILIKQAEHSRSMVILSNMFPLNCIDLTEAGEFGVNYFDQTKISCDFVVDSIYHSLILARGAIVISNRIYLQDVLNRKKILTTETFYAGELKTVGIGNAVKQMSYNDVLNSAVFTWFVIDSNNAKIYLSYQYSELGTNKFTIQQKNNYKAQIYDEFNRLIFDGREYGDGIYTFVCTSINAYPKGRNEDTVFWDLM